MVRILPLLACLLSPGVIEAQIVRSTQRFQVQVPERLAVSSSAPVLVKTQGVVTLQQSLVIESRPSEGLIVAVALESPAKERQLDRQVERPLMGDDYLLQASAEQVQWVSIPSAPSAASRLFQTIPRPEPAIQVDVQVALQEDQTTPTLVTLTIAPLP